MVQHFQLSAVVRLSECRKKNSFYSRKREHSGCQWRVEAVAGAVGPAISGSCSTNSTSRKDTANVANIPKTTIFNWPINTNHDLQMLHLCTDQELKSWQSISCVKSTVNIPSDRFPCLRAWPQRTRRWVHPKESWKLQQFVVGIQNKHLIFLRIVFSL